jgi:hypothetical protein
MTAATRSPSPEPVLNSAPALWDVAACAQFLGKSPRWLWSALRRSPEEPGSIPHVRIGRSPRFFPDDIAEWVRQGCPPPAMLAQWQDAKGKRRKSAG